MVSLLRLYNDSILAKEDSDGAPLRPTIWNRYLEYFKGQSPLAKIVVTILNIIRITEIPAEMLIGKLLGVVSKNSFVIVAELCKMLMRTFLWVVSGFRKGPLSLTPTSSRLAMHSISKSELSSSDIITQTLESEHPEYLQEYIKGSRTDPLLLMPEHIMPKCRTKTEKLRELSTIVRPLLYATIYLNAGSIKTKWLAWSSALGLDIFSNWPEIQEFIFKKVSIRHSSSIEKDESQARVFRLLLYLLREPFYSDYTKSRISALLDSLSEWRILKPVVATASTYQKLCELIYFYTSAS